MKLHLTTYRTRNQLSSCKDLTWRRTDRKDPPNYALTLHTSTRSMKPSTQTLSCKQWYEGTVLYQSPGWGNCSWLKEQIRTSELSSTLSADTIWFPFDACYWLNKENSCAFHNLSATLCITSIQIKSFFQQKHTTSNTIQLKTYEYLISVSSSTQRACV
jgi:hypothetical protein